MIKEWFDISWGAPENYVALPVIIIGIVLLLYRHKKKQRALQLLAGNYLSSLLKNTSPQKQVIKLVCMGVGLLFLFIALLRPQWNKKEQTIAQEGRDVYIALDISRSMLAADCKPNRLALAKTKIKRLIKKLSCERVGLILFSGSAFVQCPLTADYSAFNLYLDQVDAELISSGTTALDAAIEKAITSFEHMPQRKSKLVVLFTDGEDFSHNLSGIKQKAAQAGLSIFTIGLGTAQGAPVPLLNEYGKQIGHQKDKTGNIVISRLNEGILQTLSHDVGGRYVCATKNDDDINTLITSLQSFEKETLEDKKLSQLEDQYHYFLLISFICFACDWLL